MITMNASIQFSFILFLLTIIPGLSGAQSSANQIIGDWTFHPNYTLYRNAENYPGNKIVPPKSRFQRFKTLGDPIIFYEQNPTERLTDFLAPSKLPASTFTIELWLLNHVNLPIGAMISARGKQLVNAPSWLLGYYGNEVVFQTNTEHSGSQIVAHQLKKRGWKKYWGHLVGTYDGDSLKLYLNGALLGTTPSQGELLLPDDVQVELSSYLSQEPYMKTSNLVKAARLYNYALSENEIQQRLSLLQEKVEAGHLFQDTFHFNAGPYLHFATQNSINILWETDRLATATIKYGTTWPLKDEIELNKPAYIQEVTLNDLQAGTPYYYQIIATSTDGSEMDSGILTFGTAVPDSAAFSFCIIGDTESRPHINHRLGEMIWEERPNFLMHLGDITDGGMENHKFEWNYEYFTGITAAASRIPVFPVPGNGESDLYWYKRYHRLPASEAYYSFKYGNAEFFMLNSNDNQSLQKGGEQYEWLKSQLAASTAKWKIVAHHHCPVSSDENDYGDTWKGNISNQGDLKFDDLKPLYESADVDIVFYGHVHAYERSWPIKDGQVDQKNGVIYIQSGGGGGNLEDFTPTHSWFSTKTQRGNHYCKVDVHSGTLSFKMYDIDGKMKDFLELKK